MKTIAVAGPRELGVDVFQVSLSIDHYFAHAPEKFIVLHGAARGVDTLCAASAERYGHVPVAYEITDEDRAAARAEGKPRKAPLWRTRRMLDAEPLFLVAWWDGESSGTGFTLREAGRRGIRTFVYPIR